MREDDKDLPGLLAHNLTQHFQQLVLTYYARLYTFVLQQTMQSEDAEDIVQETFLRAYFSLKTYEAERIRTLALRPWLYKIALNLFYSRMRKHGPKSIALDASEEGPHLAIEDDERLQPEIHLEDKETLQEVVALVQRLPTMYRDVLYCYYFEDFSYQEISEILNMPLSTVKTRLFRGIRLLRAALEAQQNGVR